MFLKPVLIASGVLGSIWAIFTGVANSAFPYAQTLIEDKNGSVVYASGYAGKYLRFLSGVDKSPQNDGWWHWTFFHRYRHVNFEPGSGFAGKENPDQLRIACKEAYRGHLDSSKSKVIRGSVSYGVDEIWKLCSPSSRGLIPKTMQEAQSDDSSSFKTQHKESLEKEASWNSDSIKDVRDKLLSIHHPNNNWVWSLRQREFNKAPEKTGFFSLSSNGRSVKDKCAKAYSSSTSSTSSTHKTDVLKWCGL